MGTKISLFTELTVPAAGDLIPIVDISEPADADKNKHITPQNLFASPQPFGITTPVAGAFTTLSATGVAAFDILKINDTDDSNLLSILWNEDDSADRALNLAVNGADRTLSLSGNLTVEAASLINQDLTTDATGVAFAGIESTPIGGATPAAGAFTTLSASGIVSIDNAVVINESGADVDFRIESDVNQNALLVRGSDGFVGLGLSNPTALLHAYSTVVGVTAIRVSSGGTGASYTDFQSGVTGATSHIYTLATDYSTSGQYHSQGVTMENEGGGGMDFSNKTTGDFRWWQNSTQRMLLTNTGALLVGDTTNVNMTLGLTINQGANDDEILAFKSSDIDHGITDFAETDTFLSIQKASATGGGFHMRGYSEVTVGMGFVSCATTVDATQTTGSDGNINLYGYKKSGTGLGAMGNDDNVFAVKNSGTTAFIVTGDGDYFYNGADGGAFDNYDDAQLLRAFSTATSNETIKSRFDDYLRYKEKDLIRVGVLGAPLKDGGLVNGAQLQRLLVGNAWQHELKLQAIIETAVELVGKDFLDRLEYRFESLGLSTLKLAA